jgi:alkylation response protein AidB-like acyl-CoA dehydrogenase
MVDPIPTHDGLAEGIERLVPVIKARADEIEGLRRLPTDIANELKGLGVFRALVPIGVGGLELPLVNFLHVVERTSQADASVAWCIAQGSVISSTTAWLPEAIARQIWDDPLACVANGPPQGCRAVTDGDGFRLTGRWSFSSGCDHATWMSGIAQDDSGKTVTLFFDKKEATFLDTWDVAGLRGTGSHDFKVADLYIKQSSAINRNKCLSTNPFYAFPTGLVFAASFASVSLGTARGALEFAKDLAKGKSARYQNSELREQSHVQSRIGQAEIRLRAARRFLFGTVEDVWDAVCARGGIENSERVDLRMASSHVIRECADVVDLAYDIVGTDGLHPNREIQRRFQDMHVITQHVQARTSVYEYAGRFHLGFEFQPHALN